MYVLISPFGCESTQGSLPVSFGVSWERGQFDAGKRETALPFLIDICTDAASKQVSLWVGVF